MKNIVVWMMLLCLGACASQNEGEKHQGARDKVIQVKDKVREIDTGDDVLIGRLSDAYFSEDYLIITDYNAWEGAIHLFDKENFRYLASVGSKGDGPYELTNAGSLMIDDVRRKLYIVDYSKYKVFSYDMDSIVSMPEAYRHQVKVRIDRNQIPSNILYVNDTLCYGRVIQPTSASTFDQMIGKWNMVTGEVKVIGETHPEVHRKRSMIDVSMEKGMIVETYSNYDLMAIMDLDGHVKTYIYGPDWTKKRLMTFGDVVIMPHHILATYSGGSWAEGRTDKIHVFDLEGNYEKTLNVGYHMTNCVYDAENHRLFMVFDDDIQFGYLNLEGII